MKRITSIVLLILILHNAVGYYFFHALRQMEVKRELARAIDRNAIPDSELLVFKVPVTLYHQLDRQDFERAEGDFKHEGRFYEMVKRKLQNETLHVYCYDNRARAQLFDDLSAHTKTHVADFKGKPIDKHEKSVLSFIKEYLPFIDNTLCFFPVAATRGFNACPVQPFCSPLLEISSPPPKQA